MIKTKLTKRDKLKNQLIKITLSAPSAKDLRSFGIVLGIISALLFSVLLPLFFQYKEPLWPLTISAALILCASLRPTMLRIIYQLWMIIGNFLGWVNTRIILGFIFTCVFFPAGMIIKVLGKDLLRKQIKVGQISYRLPSRHRNRAHFENPY